MFTFPDIPKRVEKRDIGAVVRAMDNESLIQALAGAAENAPETREFILSSISSRVAEQLREELGEAGKIKIRIAEDAQNAMIRTIRELETAGELTLVDDEDE